MSQFKPGTYFIVPQDAKPKTGLGFDVIEPIFPPPDVPVEIFGQKLIARWVVKAAENNTFTVFAGKAQSDDYKWTVEEKDALYVTVTGKPVSFRFESAGNDLWVIGLSGQDALLTVNKNSGLIFERSDGSDAQHFKAIPVNKD